jgi:hypothetical protein
MCSAAIPRAATGRPARYCGVNCRQAAHRERVRQADEAAARARALADARTRARRTLPLIAESRADARAWLQEAAGSAADPGLDQGAVVAAFAELRAHVDRMERAALAYRDAISDERAASEAIAARR